MWAQAVDLGQSQDLAGAVGGGIERGLLRILLGHVEVENLGRELQPLDVHVLAADHPDRVVVIAVYRMQRLQAFLAPK